jgi:membrane-bound lytic murein transglycosylase D
VSWTTYNAKRYESIDAIAKRHGVTSAQLRAANDQAKLLDKKGRLRAAGPILVPMAKGAAAQPVRVATVSVPTASSAATPRAAAPARASAPQEARTYVVRAGDTLYSIARRFNTAVDALLAVNKLTAASVIQPGLRLRLP